MGSTITAYYGATSTAKGASSEVNNNFNLYRGNVYPYATDTATTTNLTHDIGSSEYNFTGKYGNAWNAPTTGAIMIINGATAAGWQQWTSDGSDPGPGGFTYKATTATLTIVTTGLYPIAGSTLTLSTIGKPVEYVFDFDDLYCGGNTSTAQYIGWQFALYVNGSVTSYKTWQIYSPAGSGNQWLSWSETLVWTDVVRGKATGVQYELYGRTTVAPASGANATIFVVAPKFLVKEVK